MPCLVSSGAVLRLPGAPVRPKCQALQITGQSRGLLMTFDDSCRNMQKLLHAFEAFFSLLEGVLLSCIPGGDL